MRSAWFTKSCASAARRGARRANSALARLNEDARAAALAFNAEALEQLQRQCEPWSANALLFGLFDFVVTPVCATAARLHSGGLTCVYDARVARLQPGRHASIFDAQVVPVAAP
jgi:hypothetical protein